MSIKLFAIIFLFAHSYIHFSLTSVPLPKPGALRTPFFPAWWRDSLDPLWPAAKLGLSSSGTQTLGWILLIISIAIYLLAILGLSGIPVLCPIWQVLMVIATVVSLILIGLYWHPWFVLGVLIDIALITSVTLQIPSSLYK